MVNKSSIMLRLSRGLIWTSIVFTIVAVLSLLWQITWTNNNHRTVLSIEYAHFVILWIDKHSNERWDNFDTGFAFKESLPNRNVRWLPERWSQYSHNCVSIPLMSCSIALLVVGIIMNWVYHQPNERYLCPRGNYNLTGNISGRYPECGQDVYSVDGSSKTGFNGGTDES